MNFTPSQTDKAQSVPYFEDASQDDGWQGHATHKNVEQLKSEVIESITRLGGYVSGFQGGVFGIDGRQRYGYQIHYSLAGSNGRLVPGRLDIAALPLRNHTWNKQQKTLCMALYMLRVGLDGMWFFQQLAPGYAPLMPWMLASPDGKTISQLWAESPVMNNLLPPGDAEFIEAEVEE